MMASKPGCTLELPGEVKNNIDVWFFVLRSGMDLSRPQKNYLLLCSRINYNSEIYTIYKESIPVRKQLTYNVMNDTSPGN